MWRRRGNAGSTPRDRGGLSLYGLTTDTRFMGTDEEHLQDSALGRPPPVDSLEETRDLAELERRLFRRQIEPIRLDRYVLLHRIASGGFGTVYQAYDPQLDRRVAVKLLHGKGAERLAADGTDGGLVAEAQVMARFSHPNVVAVYDVGEFSRTGYLVHPASQAALS